MTGRAILSMVLAFAVPGLGHLYLGRRARAAAFFAIIVLMFVIGFAIEGGIYTVATSNNILRVLASYASMGSGLLYALGLAIGKPGNIAAATYEYGRTFTLTAGLMNLLLVLDCWDIVRGRKE